MKETLSRCELRTLTPGGDAKITWDAANSEEVATARRIFDDLRAKGYSAFSVAQSGGRDQLLQQFDAGAERIVMVPPIAGGC